MKRRFYNSFSGSSRHFGGSSEGEESSKGALLLLTLFPTAVHCHVELLIEGDGQAGQDQQIEGGGRRREAA